VLTDSYSPQVAFPGIGHRYGRMTSQRRASGRLSAAWEKGRPRLPWTPRCKDSDAESMCGALAEREAKSGDVAELVEATAEPDNHRGA
jgi:hypothetical protein